MQLVDGIDIDKKYPIEEIISMYRAGRLKPIAVAGYVVRADSDGLVGFVPWHESTLARQEAGTQVSVPFDVEAMREDVEREHPIVRRTPEERVVAVLMRILGEAKRSGTITGLTDEQITEVTGMAWRSGITEVTSEMVRRVAAHFLANAEVDNREADSHRSTRRHATA